MDSDPQFEGRPPASRSNVGPPAGIRVGLTGGLGSGKSTVARMFGSLGVYTISADEIGRELMNPGTAVYDQILGTFGSGLLRPDGTLDRRALAKLAFTEGRLAALNRIVHPAVIAAQDRWTAEVLAHTPGAITMVESALIFEVDREVDQQVYRKTNKDADPAVANSSNVVRGAFNLRQRFDKIVVVVVPEETKIARYVHRVSRGGWNDEAAADARSRLATQIPDKEKIILSDYVIQNTGTEEETMVQVRGILKQLQLLTPAAEHLRTDDPPAASSSGVKQ